MDQLIEETEEKQFTFPATSSNCPAEGTAYTDASIAIASQRFDMHRSNSAGYPWNFGQNETLA